MKKIVSQNLYLVLLSHKTLKRIVFRNKIIQSSSDKIVLSSEAQGVKQRTKSTPTRPLQVFKGNNFKASARLSHTIRQIVV